MTDYFQTGTFATGKYGKSWHGKEVDFEPIVAADNVTSAMKKAQMYDVHVDKYPMYIHIGNNQVLSEQTQLAMVNVPWNDNGVQLLDRAVSWYDPVQNKDYANIVDPLTEQYPIIGTLMCGKRGEVMVVQLEMPDFEIGGLSEERHKSFMLIAEDRRSGLKTFGTVNTRVVCQNTYNMALSEKGKKSLPNSTDSKAILAFRVKIEQKAITSRQTYIDGLNHLFKKKVGNSDIDQLLKTLFPQPQKSQIVQMWENNQDIINLDNEQDVIFDKKGARAFQLYVNSVDRQRKYQRELVEEFFDFNDNHSYAANTAYGLWQAVTHFYNHSDSWNSQTDVHQYNLLFGEKAKQQSKAWNLLTK